MTDAKIADLVYKNIRECLIRLSQLQANKGHTVRNLEQSVRRRQSHPQNEVGYRKQVANLSECYSQEIEGLTELENLYHQLEEANPKVKADSKQPTKKPCYLLKLPTELRNTIYAEAFTGRCDVIQVTKYHNVLPPAGKPQWFVSLPRLPPLARVCKQLRDEVPPIYYQNTAFDVSQITSNFSDSPVDLTVWNRFMKQHYRNLRHVYSSEKISPGFIRYSSTGLNPHSLHPPDIRWRVDQFSGQSGPEVSIGLCGCPHGTVRNLCTCFIEREIKEKHRGTQRGPYVLDYVREVKSWVKRCRAKRRTSRLVKCHTCDMDALVEI